MAFSEAKESFDRARKQTEWFRWLSRSPANMHEQNFERLQRFADDGIEFETTGPTPPLPDDPVLYFGEEFWRHPSRRWRRLRRWPLWRRWLLGRR